MKNTFLNTDEIIKLLADKGIAVSRKILREDIKTLNDYGFLIVLFLLSQ